MDALLHAEKLKKFFVYIEMFGVTNCENSDIRIKTNSWQKKNLTICWAQDQGHQAIASAEPTRTNDKVGGLANLARFPAKIWQVLSFFETRPHDPFLENTRWRLEKFDNKSKCLLVKTCSIPFFIFHTHLKGLLPALNMYQIHSWKHSIDHPHFFT